MSAPFTIRVDASAAIAAISDLHQNQIPYALSLSLTMTAQDAVPEVRNQFRRSFIVRNSWTEKGVRWQRATKQSLTSWVEFNKDYMALHETGGYDIPHKGHKYIAVPIGELAQQVKAGRIIPPSLRPVRLLGVDTKLFMKYMAKGMTRKAKNWGQGLIMEVNGHKIIAQRTGPGYAGLHLLYVLVPRTHQVDRLKMFETVRAVSQRRFAINFQDALSKAIATAR